MAYWRKGRDTKNEINYFGEKNKQLIIKKETIPRGMEKIIKKRRWDVTLASRTGRSLSRTQHRTKALAREKARRLMKKYGKSKARKK